MTESFEPEARREGRDETSEAAPQPKYLAAEAAQILERALAEVESMLGQLEGDAAHPARMPAGAESVPSQSSERTGATNEVVWRLDRGLDRLAIEAERLSQQVSRFAEVGERLEARVSELTATLRQGAPPPVRDAAREPEPVAPREPQFPPADQALELVIAAVPGFQGLMDAQRALSTLPAVKGASVHRYQNGEASMAVALRAGVTAREMVEGLRRATGHQLVIEEARPEALRLRLRFIDQEGRGLGSTAERLG